MSAEKHITITATDGIYTFVVNLAEKRLELVTVKTSADGGESIVSLNRVPDKVQIKFYQSLRQLQNESSSPTIDKPK